MSRTTLRVRLTVLYAGTFFLAGAVLLTVMYLLVKQDLNDRLGINAGYLQVVGGGQGEQVTGRVGQSGTTTPQAQTSPRAPGTPLTTVQMPDGTRVNVADLPKVFAEKQVQIRDETLGALVAQGGIALLAIGVVAALFGWLAAERALRPVHAITATARRVAAAASAQRDLRDRIGMRGPADEIKELADTFDDMLERLDRSFDGQRRFVANASHELRTPLAINRALAEVVATRPGVSEDARQLAESVLAVNGRNERLIEGLLTLAASENEVTERVDVDLSAIAAHVLDGTDLQGIECTARELLRGPVLGDPVLLERLTQNLVDNAVRHNRPGGWLSVTTGARDGWVVLTVTNSGRQVAPYELESVFEPFRRLEGDRVGSTRGFGLGLSIVRAVARAHGGEAIAVPGPDGGLMVTVRLPVAAAVRAIRR